MQQNLTLILVLGTLMVLMVIGPIVLLGGAFGTVDPLRGDKPGVLSEFHDPGLLKNEGACASIPEQAPDRLYRTYIGNASVDAGISAAFIAAVVKQESAFRNDAVSKAGAMGAMQIMPATFSSLEITHRKHFIGRYKPDLAKLSPFNAQYNIYLGANYLKYNFGLFRQRERVKYELTAAAYNAGPGTVQKYGYPENMPSPGYDETKNYVQSVLKFYNDFKPCEEQIKVGQADHPNIRKLISYVQANPGAYAQCSATGCADANSVLLRAVFPKKDPRSGPSLGKFPNRPRAAPPTFQDLDRARSELSGGNFPVWHINGQDSGQHWIILVRVKDNNITFFDPADGNIKTYPANKKVNGDTWAYFGITPEGSRGGNDNYERGYVFKP